MCTNHKLMKFLLTSCFILSACSSFTPKLKPGDAIGDMTLHNSGREIVPLWAFCSPAFQNLGVTETECQVPLVPELAIGHGEYFSDEVLRDANWSAFTWQLYLDGKAIDLEAFGYYDGDLPMKGLPGHGAEEEVITKLRTYDVYIKNLTAGKHTLRSVLKVTKATSNGFHDIQSGTYELIVKFTVQ